MERVKLYISEKEWIDFLKGKIKENRIYAPFGYDKFLFFSILKEENLSDIVYNKVRTVEPFKIFLYPFKEFIVPEIKEFQKFVVMGVTSCDLKGLEILDIVFKEGDFKDPNYNKKRENILIISFDCLEPNETCFCTQVSVNPFPSQNFDLNLCKTKEGFLIEVGSEKGKDFIGKDARFYQANQSQIKEVEEMRNETIKKIKEINKDFEIEKAKDLKGLYYKEFWEKSKDIRNCVACGSCTANCPTCVCFLLEDTSEDGNFKKVKIWDSCQFPGYARMASGATPRPTLFDRYANRLLCKYWYMKENFGSYGCTGCGRCISGCIGRIDKRKVITEVLREKVLR